MKKQEENQEYIDKEPLGNGLFFSGRIMQNYIQKFEMILNKTEPEFWSIFKEDYPRATLEFKNDKIVNVVISPFLTGEMTIEKSPIGIQITGVFCGVSERWVHLFYNEYTRLYGVPSITEVSISKPHKDSGHYHFDPKGRKEIADEFRELKRKGRITNNEGFAQSKSISDKTLRNYLREFPET